MLIRSDNITLELCRWGYCFVNRPDQPLSLHSGTSLGMGWIYVLIPLILGIFIGIIITLLIYKIIIRQCPKQTDTSSKSNPKSSLNTIKEVSKVDAGLEPKK